MEEGRETEKSLVSDDGWDLVPGANGGKGLISISLTPIPFAVFQWLA